MRFFLRKHNILSHEKEISALFNGGSSLFNYPIKMAYRLTDVTSDEAVYKVMFVVSKRSFKRAVKRNLIRRRMREVFRLNVHTIFDSIPENKRVDIALIFVSKDIVETPVIEKSVNDLLHKLKTKLKVE